MAHFVKLHQLDMHHDNSMEYIPMLFNLDTVVSIETSISKKHSIIVTRWNTNGIRVKESLDEIYRLANSK
jgi:hypothetical protein